MRENLKAARKAKGMTQQQMADELNNRRWTYAYDKQLVVAEDGTIYKRHRDNLWYFSAYQNGDGYQRITVKTDGNKKCLLVHRLVAELFIPNPKCYPQVNHIDGNKTNNHVNNLEWCDCAYNVRDSKKRHAERYLTNLKAIRKNRKIPIQKMSRSLGLLQGRYQDIEHAVTKPDIETAKRIEQFFGMSIDILLSEYREDGSIT